MTETNVDYKPTHTPIYTQAQLDTAVREAIEAERERCAKIVNDARGENYDLRGLVATIREGHFNNWIFIHKGLFMSTEGDAVRRALEDIVSLSIIVGESDKDEAVLKRINKLAGDALTAFATVRKEARKAALLQAAKDVCMYCSGNATGYESALGPNAAGNYTHCAKNMRDKTVLCEASSIYARLRFEAAAAAPVAEHVVRCVHGVPEGLTCNVCGPIRNDDPPLVTEEAETKNSV